jgi:hypothetical protein
MAGRAASLASLTAIVKAEVLAAVLLVVTRAAHLLRPREA